jgi:hypothetical protein
MCIFGDDLMRINDIINEDVNEGPIDWALSKMGNKKAQVRQDDSGEVKTMTKDFLAKARGRATPALLAKYLNAAGFPVNQRKVLQALQVGDNNLLKKTNKPGRIEPTVGPTTKSQKPKTGDKKQGYTFQGLQWTNDKTNRIASKAERKQLGLDGDAPSSGTQTKSMSMKQPSKPKTGDTKNGFTYRGAEGYKGSWTKNGKMASNAEKAKFGLGESTITEAVNLSKSQVSKIISYFVAKGGRENIAPNKRSKNAYNSTAKQPKPDTTEIPTASNDTSAKQPSRRASDRDMEATLNKAASILSKAGISGVRVVPDYD